MRKRISKRLAVEAVDDKQGPLHPREDTPAPTFSTQVDKSSYLEAMAVATPDTMITLDANYHVLDL